MAERKRFIPPLVDQAETYLRKNNFDSSAFPPDIWLSGLTQATLIAFRSTFHKSEHFVPSTKIRGNRTLQQLDQEPNLEAQAVHQGMTKFFQETEKHLPESLLQQMVDREIRESLSEMPRFADALLAACKRTLRATTKPSEFAKLQIAHEQLVRALATVIYAQLKRERVTDPARVGERTRIILSLQARKTDEFAEQLCRTVQKTVWMLHTSR